MKEIKFSLAIIFSACLLFSCTGNNNKDVNHGGSSASAPSTNAENNGGSFSVLINGTKVSGGATDEMQVTNRAFIYPAGSIPQSKAESVYFNLMPDKLDENYYSLRFIYPDKTGTYNKTKNSNDCDCSLLINYFSGNYTGILATYIQDSITTTISAISASRVTGTFSGKFISSLGDGFGKNQAPVIMVTDGKFDIPFSKAKNKPQL